MIQLIFLLLISRLSSCSVIPYHGVTIGITPYSAPVNSHSQYHAQDKYGQYVYGYASGLSSKDEIKTADGVTRGGYSYIDANGILQTVQYISDPVNGFRVVATNIPRDVPAVAIAKAQHFQAFENIKAEHAYIRALQSHGPVVISPQPVGNTWVAPVSAPLVHTHVASAPVAYVPRAVHHIPIPISSQYHSQDNHGHYSYGYTGPLSSKTEIKSPDGVTRGGYSYIDANGVLQTVQYVADPVHGFQVQATNLPEAPAVTLIGPKVTTSVVGPKDNSATIHVGGTAGISQPVFTNPIVVPDSQGIAHEPILTNPPALTADAPVIPQADLNSPVYTNPPVYAAPANPTVLSHNNPGLVNSPVAYSSGNLGLGNPGLGNPTVYSNPEVTNPGLVSPPVYSSPGHSPVYSQPASPPVYSHIEANNPRLISPPVYSQVDVSAPQVYSGPVNPSVYSQVDVNGPVNPSVYSQVDLNRPVNPQVYSQADVNGNPAVYSQIDAGNPAVYSTNQGLENPTVFSQGIVSNNPGLTNPPVHTVSFPSNGRILTQGNHLSGPSVGIDSQGQVLDSVLLQHGGGSDIASTVRPQVFSDPNAPLIIQNPNALNRNNLLNAPQNYQIPINPHRDATISKDLINSVPINQEQGLIYQGQEGRTGPFLQQNTGTIPDRSPPLFTPRQNHVQQVQQTPVSVVQPEQQALFNKEQASLPISVQQATATGPDIQGPTGYYTQQTEY